MRREVKGCGEHRYKRRGEPCRASTGGKYGWDRREEMRKSKSGVISRSWNTGGMKGPHPRLVKRWKYLKHCELKNGKSKKGREGGENV